MSYAYIDITETPENALRIAKSLYTRQDQARIQHFLQLNELSEMDMLPVGSVLVVPSADLNSCTQDEVRLAASVVHLRKQRVIHVDGKPQQGIIDSPSLVNQYHGVLEQANTYGSGGLGIYSGHASRRIKMVEDILRELQQLYRSTYNTTGGLSGSGFLQKRRQLMFRLDRVMKGWVRTGLIGPGEQGVRAGLGISTKRTVHRWRLAGSSAAGIPELEQRINRLNNMSKVAKRVGYLGIAMDVSWSISEIQRHMEAGGPNRNRNIAGETGRLVGSIGGGAGGGMLATYLVCNVFGGIQTAGTSLLWCGLVAGGAGALVGGSYGSKYGQGKGYQIYDSRGR